MTILCSGNTWNKERNLWTMAINATQRGDMDDYLLSTRVAHILRLLKERNFAVCHTARQNVS